MPFTPRTGHQDDIHRLRQPFGLVHAALGSARRSLLAAATSTPSASTWPWESCDGCGLPIPPAKPRRYRGAR